MKTERHPLQEQLQSLFARCPDLCGFSVREEAQELYVSDIGISPRLSAEQYGEIYQDIAETLRELLDEEPRAGEWLRGRTFARVLQ
jgi:phosphotransacetylase